MCNKTNATNEKKEEEKKRELCKQKGINFSNSELDIIMIMIKPCDDNSVSEYRMVFNNKLRNIDREEKKGRSKLKWGNYKESEWVESVFVCVCVVV